MKNIIISTSDVKGESWEFRTHPAWQRLIIMLGGIIVNFLTAFVIYAMVLFVWGESFVKSEDMTYGMKFSEQAKADGFRDGDIIIRTDDEDVPSWNTAVLQDMSNAKTVTVLRQGEEVTINMPEEISLLDMIEQPERYSEQQILELLADEEVRKHYEVMVRLREAYDMEGKSEREESERMKNISYFSFAKLPPCSSPQPSSAVWPSPPTTSYRQGRKISRRK